MRTWRTKRARLQPRRGAVRFCAAEESDSTEPKERAAENAEEKEATPLRLEDCSVENIEDCAVVDPAALNLLACHFIAHHREHTIEYRRKSLFMMS